MRIGSVIILLVVVLAFVIYFIYSPQSFQIQEDNKAVMEISELPVEESLVEAEGVLLVRSYCTGCHSEKIIMQNRATREGWESMIRWMQKTQNLGDLGTNESQILDYLEENYSPIRKGRRMALEVEWYELPD